MNDRAKDLKVRYVEEHVERWARALLGDLEGQVFVQAGFGDDVSRDTEVRFRLIGEDSSADADALARRIEPTTEKADRDEHGVEIQRVWAPTRPDEAGDPVVQVIVDVAIF